MMYVTCNNNVIFSTETELLFSGKKLISTKNVNNKKRVNRDYFSAFYDLFICNSVQKSSEEIPKYNEIKSKRFNTSSNNHTNYAFMILSKKYQLNNRHKCICNNSLVNTEVSSNDGSGSSGGGNDKIGNNNGGGNDENNGGDDEEVEDANQLELLSLAQVKYN